MQNKEIMLKAAREKCQVTYKGKAIRIIAHFSTETPKARRAWNDVFQHYCIQQSYPSQLK
jgi:hypothetical protein